MLRASFNLSATLSVRAVAVMLFAFAVAAEAQSPRAKGTSPRSPRKTAAQKPRVNYSRFLHSTHVEKQKLACDSCHKFPTKNWKEVRRAEVAFADVAEFPEHSACLDCHHAQFFARERPAPLICSNCHVNVRPRDSTRYLFPSLGDVSDPTKKRRDSISDFAVNFPHDKHVDVLGSNFQPSPGRGLRFLPAGFQKDKPKEENCAMCHGTYQPQGDAAEEYVTKPPGNIGDAFWLKKGTFKTIPVSHEPCSSCHSAEAGIEPALSQCEVCHKLLSPSPGATDFDPRLATTMGIVDRVILGRWQRRESSGTFPHDGGGHSTLSCTTCHNLATMNTTEPKSLKVAVKSCAGADGCHITATSEEGGALNYEIDQKKKKPDSECTKCHIVFGKQALPTSHSEAIPKPVIKSS